MMEFKHVTVLKNETIDILNVRPDKLYADMTLGGGGHSEALLEKGARVIGIDWDAQAIEAARERLKCFGDKFTAYKSNFKDIKNVLAELGIASLDGAVMDLGVSSYQLDTADRGFSYMSDAPLDMRMDASQGVTAYEVVNTYTKTELAAIIKKYGEENWAARIAEFIEEKRQHTPIKTTGELVDVIKAAIPKSARQDGPHPAKRTFQAIRIEVNRELEILEQAVRNCVDCLSPGGVIGIISFHSLEDRIVKKTFASLHRGCVCPENFPVCVCGEQPKVKILSRKPILPSETEIEINPRSRSAKLRAAEKI